MKPFTLKLIEDELNSLLAVFTLDASRFNAEESNGKAATIRLFPLRDVSPMKDAVLVVSPLHRDLACPNTSATVQVSLHTTS